jgi:hypothetical protein
MPLFLLLLSNPRTQTPKQHLVLSLRSLSHPSSLLPFSQLAANHPPLLPIKLPPALIKAKTNFSPAFPSVSFSLFLLF